MILNDEIKDTTEKSKTMEFLLSEILISDDIRINKEKLENSIQELIDSKKDIFNSFIEESISLNENITRSKNFVESKKLDSLQKFLKINKEDFSKLSSGHKTFALLQILKNSSKQHIFIDEPEKFSHPSLQHKIANIINELVKNGKYIYIVSHSPKLVSMLDFEFENLYIMNDNKNLGFKKIEFEEDIKNLIDNKIIILDQADYKTRSYYENKESLIKNILNIHKRYFINSLFTKKIYIIEGVNDLLYLNFLLSKSNNKFDEYEIFQCFGKFQMPILLKFLKALELIFLLFLIETVKKIIYIKLLIIF